ncbi:MAG: hypothetical protein HY308_15685 [Gammaproteobacteria bacterium]|nr:hypothetical protein [Gammaproteobacteria bacterium]
MESIKVCFVLVVFASLLSLGGCGGGDSTGEPIVSDPPNVDYPLNVTVNGAGAVTSTPGGINCGTSCSSSYAAGSAITLTATPSSGYLFGGWSGACLGTGNCSLSMNAAKTVTATFVNASTGATITITPSDETTGVVTDSRGITTNNLIKKIEAANPGDTVLISPGTYHSRLHLTKNGTAGYPIFIKALDPSNRPVFDYTGKNVSDWPGSEGPASYNSNSARAAWLIGSCGVYNPINGQCQWVGGTYYTIDGIVIQGARHDAVDSTGGIRYGGADHLTVRHCRFYDNSMGIMGGGTWTLIEYTEFDSNGVQGTDQSHNLYIFGGDNFTLQYSYSHDSVGGQNFHIRARNATVAYSWFENAGDYEGDMMTDSAAYDPNYDGTQALLFIGNVVIQNPNPGNQTKLITMYNDTGATINMSMTVLWNTFIFKDAGSNGGNGSGVIQLGNASMVSSTLTFSNNVVGGVNYRKAYVVSAPGTANYTVTGSNNFMLTGSTVGVLTGTVFAANAMFTSPATGDYTLAAGSAARDAANTSVTPQPTAQYRATVGVSARTAVTDMGAVQH